MRNAHLSRSRFALLGSLAIVALAASGCAKLGTDHVEVGSIPDDYRTRHPIVIAENTRQLAVPVGAGVRPLTFAEKEVVAGFLADVEKNGSGAVQIAVPAGAGNSAAAGHVANEIQAVAAKAGLASRTMVTSYAAPADQPTPPVVVSYQALTAGAGPCGKWPDDALAKPDNKNYHNFGCAYQNNLAAQIANPMDLLHPRNTGPIDAADRDTVIGGYRDNTGTWAPSIDY